jgi:hypothetical protein
MSPRTPKEIKLDSLAALLNLFEALQPGYARLSQEPKPLQRGFREYDEWREYTVLFAPFALRARVKT